MINLIKQYRDKMGITQEELARNVGVTSRTIISLERGKYKPSLVLAYKLARFFNTDIETLFSLKEFLEDTQDENNH